MKRAVAAILLALLVLPFIWATLVALSVSGWALDRSFYLRLLDDRRLYELWLKEEPSRGLSALVLRAWEDSGVAAPPLPALAAALPVLLTPDYLRSQALAAVNEAFDALQEGRARFSLNVDLAPLKGRLAGPAGREFAQRLAEALPVCSASEGAQELTACRPESVTPERHGARIADRLPELAAELPDRLAVGPTRLGPLPSGWRFFTRPKAVLAAAIGMAALLAAMWAGLCIVAGDDRRERLFWMGGSLMLPSLATLAAGLAVLPWASSGWLQWVIRQATGARLWPYQDLIVQATRQAARAFSGGLLLCGAIATGTALGFLLWAAAVDRGSRPPTGP